MTDKLITHLRHVDLGVPDYAKTVEFYRDRWQLSVAHSERGLTYFAAEGSPERFVLRIRDTSDKRIDLVAFGAADRTGVDTLAEKLGRAGIDLISEPDTLPTLGGGYGFRFFDIDGRVIEISSDVIVRQHRTIEERESIPVALSHVVLNSPDPMRTRRFYEKHLGFELSDTLTLPNLGDVFYFMRCSSAHHSLGIARAPHVALNHVSFELRGIDEFMRGTGRLIRAGGKHMFGPGRHVAGDNTFAYFLDTVGNTVEYTTELEKIDAQDWSPHVYDLSDDEIKDAWGTAQMADMTTRDQFNDPDKGLFVAPPI